MFVPLHVKSDYSLGFGTAAPEKLAARAAESGYEALALTDIENLYGQVRFHAECRNLGLRALTGVELRADFIGGRYPGRREGRLVLLAEDRTGYSNLCRIVTARRCRKKKEGPGDPAAALAGRTAGIFALSDDLEILGRLLVHRYFPLDRLGFLVVRPAAADIEARIPDAVRLGFPLVADLDALFLDPGDYELHLLQLAVHMGCRVTDAAGDPAVENHERLLRSPREAHSLFSDLPEALRTARRIAEACRLDLTRDATFHASLPMDPEAGRKLRRHCDDALKASGSPLVHRDPAHERRLAEELEIFEELGFTSLLLIVAEILAFCRRNSIPATARGSAVGSLTLHLLGGSPVDPLDHGLLFERFLHRAKSAWPDIDLDLPWHRRDEVIRWVHKRYGHEKTAMVSAHHTFQRRSALREGLKACGVPAGLIKSLSAALPAEDLEIEEVDFLGLAQEISQKDGLADTSTASAEGALAGLLPRVQRLIGRPRHIATHPGGVVVADTPLAETIPLERAATGRIITQYDPAALAALGMVKIDLLGSRCLSELEETLHLAGSGESIDDIPADDAAALRLIDRAETLGCFQLESPAMRSLLASLPVRRKSDLTAALALIRPGAASGTAKENFIRRARGEITPDPVDPAIAGRTAETYGLLIYEEDIMELLSRVGGISLAEADELRGAIIKSGGDADALAPLEKEFLEKAALNSRQGASPRRAQRAWTAASRFAAYSFNKAHAASYGHLAYLSAYMKAHHPQAFACALLNHHQGLYPLRTLAAEFQRRGIIIRPPHVNHSQYASIIEEKETPAVRGAIRTGLGKIKGLTVRSAERIVRDRDCRGIYFTLADLLDRVHLSARELRALLLCGACDLLAPLCRENYPFMHELVLSKLDEGMDPAALISLRPPAVRQKGRQLHLYRDLARIQNELSFLEMHLSAHPQALLRCEAGRYHCLTISQALSLTSGERTRLFAIVAAARRVRSSGGTLQFITLEDETGLLEAVILPRLYASLGRIVTTPGPYLVDGLLQRKHGSPHLEITALAPFHKRSRPYQQKSR